MAEKNLHQKQEYLPKVEIKECFNCQKSVDENSFCFGCKNYICDECDVNGINLFGKHQCEDHLFNNED